MNAYLAAGRAAGRDGALRRDLYMSSKEVGARGTFERKER
jgi:hypothetical protein